MFGAGAAAWFVSRSSPSPEPAARMVRPPSAPSPAIAAPAPAAPPQPVEVPVRSSVPKRVVAPVAAPATPTNATVTTATLRVEADVPEATVFLDRVGIGTVPMTIPNIAPGSHRLNVSAPGYDGYSENLELEAGERTIRVAFKEVRLDATIDVVHKHGMGSCKGRIVASVEGLRYVATDGKDNVSLPFADVETFDVDVLAKNLRVKTRQGRTFNFADPDGDGNRLFIFHRDVDKARRRLVAAR